MKFSNNVISLSSARMRSLVTPLSFIAGMIVLSLGFGSLLPVEAQVNVSTTFQIRCLVAKLLHLTEGSFGALIMVVAGIAFLVSAAMGAYRASVSLLVVAIGAFTLRSFIVIFFNSSAWPSASCGTASGGGNLTGIGSGGGGGGISGGGGGISSGGGSGGKPQCAVSAKCANDPSGNSCTATEQNCLLNGDPYVSAGGGGSKPKSGSKQKCGISAACANDLSGNNCSTAEQNCILNGDPFVLSSSGGDKDSEEFYRKIDITECSSKVSQECRSDILTCTQEELDCFNAISRQSASAPSNTSAQRRTAVPGLTANLSQLQAVNEPFYNE